MGRTVIETASDREDLEVVVGFDVTDVETVDGVPVRDASDVADALAAFDPAVAVDFTVPESTVALAAASESVPVVKAANFSRGIQALLRTVREAVTALDGYDLELLETHHNGKVDAPSGTAKTVLETVQEHRDVEPVYGREGHAPRDEDEIGVFARRAGDVRGEHELVLAGNDEVVSLSHRAEDRAVFAAGALDAAAWLAGRDPGRYEFGSVVDAE